MKIIIIHLPIYCILLLLPPLIQSSIKKSDQDQDDYEDGIDYDVQHFPGDNTENPSTLTISSTHFLDTPPGLDFSSYNYGQNGGGRNDTFLEGQDSNFTSYSLQGGPDDTPSLSEWATGFGHPCYRPCSLDPNTRMTCHYRFVLEHMLTMSTHCGNCPSILHDCFRPGCVAADGVQRVVDTVNRAMPGEAIRVCEGDTVVVDVYNLLFEPTSIHWHGIHQKSTPWMDGVPQVTQCPIPTHGHFRYEFDVPIGGTYFWHSHAGLQRGDGIYGTLIVRKAEENEPHGPANNRLYDFDLPEHELVVMDWQKRRTLNVLIDFQYGALDFRPNNALVNGRGWPHELFNESIFSDPTQGMMPLHECRIHKGFSYRFRLISNGLMSCPIEMSIENHTMEVISSDGFDVAPYVVDSLVLYAGERWDVVIHGNQPIGSYWIKFKGLNVCTSRRVFQVAVLNYEGVPRGTVPNHFIKSWKESSPPAGGTQLNPLNLGPGDRSEFVTVAELSNIQDDDREIITRKIVDHKFYLAFDFNRVDNIRMNTSDEPHKVGHVVNIEGKLYTPQISFITHVMPKSPPMSQPEAIPSMQLCNNQNDLYQLNQQPAKNISEGGRNCREEFCACTHLLKVRLNSIVELVMIDKGHTTNANHPFHLHGHSFRVIGLERLNSSVTLEHIQELDSKNLLMRRRFNPPIKDTVTVPDGGYTIVRFRADNPGFWYFHCHIEFHAEVGMGLIFQVGEVSQMLKAPDDFPRCGHSGPIATPTPTPAPTPSPTTPAPTPSPTTPAPTPSPTTPAPTPRPTRTTTSRRPNRRCEPTGTRCSITPTDRYVNCCSKFCLVFKGQRWGTCQNRR